MPPRPPVPPLFPYTTLFRSLVPLADLDGLETVRGRDHGVAVHLEHLADELPELLLVLGEQDGLRASGDARTRAVARRSVDDPFDLRQIDLERGAAPRLDVGPDIAAPLLDDPVDGRAPQTRSLAGGLGCEERLEDVGHR